MKVLSAIVGLLLSANLILAANSNAVLPHPDENNWTTSPVEEETTAAEAVVGGKTRNLQYSIKIVGGVPATKGEFKVSLYLVVIRAPFRVPTLSVDRGCWPSVLAVCVRKGLQRRRTKGNSRRRSELESLTSTLSGSGPTRAKRNMASSPSNIQPHY
jgi:hypothetical protein